MDLSNVLAGKYFWTFSLTISIHVSFFIRKTFITKLTSKTQNLKKILRKSPGSIALAAILKNANFPQSSLKVTKLSKFEHVFLV